MSNIPLARAKIFEALVIVKKIVIAQQEAIDLMSDGLELMNKEPATRRAKHASAKATVGLKASIKLYAQENPEALLSDIANKFNVNVGRVSEALKK